MIVSFGHGPTTLTGPVIDGYVLRQLFVAEDYHIKSVSVLFSTYKRSNYGQIVAELLDSAGMKLGSDSVRAESLKDNAYHVFNFNADVIPGMKCELRIRTLHCRSGMAPTAHYSSSHREGCFLFVSGKLQRESELVCDITYGLKHDATTDEALIKSDKRIVEFLKGGEQTLSVIILTKDGYGLITKCIDCLLKSSRQPDEIIIGDTGTTDERILGFYETLPSNVKVVSGLSYHFSKTNNELAARATGTHVLFLNNDVFLKPGAVEAMMEYTRVYSVGAVGLRLLKLRGVIEHDGQVLFKDGQIAVPDHLHVNWPLERVSCDSGLTDGVTAACMLTNRKLFLELGGFDTGYDDIYQDCDYCMVLAKAGFSCVTARSQTGMHIGSATRGVTQRDATRKDRERFLEKWKFSGRTTPVFSFITCCNNHVAYSGLLHSFSNRESGDVEMIPVLNNDNLFTITEALNMAKTVARGTVLVYCHQDIVLCDRWTDMVKKAMDGIQGSVGIVGFEGLADGGTPYSCYSIKKGNHVKVQTLDELCLITSRRNLSFDEGFKFHYYGADICMEAEKAGFENWLIGVPTKHLSGGDANIRSNPEAFKAEARMFRKKWHGDVWTTTTKFIDGGIVYMIMASELNQ